MKSHGVGRRFLALKVLPSGTGRNAMEILFLLAIPALLVAWYWFIFRKNKG